MDKQPTRGATARFERLDAPRLATITLPARPGEGRERRVSGTIVHIAAGCMCLRLDGGQDVNGGFAGLQDGDFAQVEVRLSDKHRFVVEGRTAWFWAPSMTGGDNTASLGIDILGAAEEDSTFWGKLRGLLSREPPLSFDRTPRPIATRQETSERRE